LNEELVQNVISGFERGDRKKRGVILSPSKGARKACPQWFDKLTMTHPANFEWRIGSYPGVLLPNPPLLFYFNELNLLFLT
jgi:hypothetical protein